MLNHLKFAWRYDRRTLALGAIVGVVLSIVLVLVEDYLL